ncbi:MAG: SAM-dependent methyltransferase [Gemmatimonadetes bacterium]|nr:SAM-dependent methyltransferase [Gemmatimonadota bacterium]
MTANYTDVVQTARDYYNSEDAETFYSTVWGGEDIHIGLYESDEDTIAEASRRTVEQLAQQLGRLDDSMHVLDMGSGYGGTARYLAETTGCRVTGLNLSEVENQRARQLNEDRGLQERVTIVDGSFEAVDSPGESFDAVCSQDAFLHSGERLRVVSEAARVLKPGGVFAFTDIMQADDCPDGVLQPILDRIHLSDLGSPAFYRSAASVQGLEEVAFRDLSPHLSTHYGRVLTETELWEAALKHRVSSDYLERMKKGLSHWVDGGERGYLVWGIFVFRKPSPA